MKSTAKCIQHSIGSGEPYYISPAGFPEGSDLADWNTSVPGRAIEVKTDRRRGDEVVKLACRRQIKIQGEPPSNYRKRFRRRQEDTEVPKHKFPHTSVGLSLSFSLSTDIYSYNPVQTRGKNLPLEVCEHGSDKRKSSDVCV